jgi:glycosyltransferase involved in cell wall biosynthesis
LARGVPAVVSADTGAVEALRAGATTESAEAPGSSVPAGDPESLAVVLRRWLAEPMLRHSWRQLALARRDTLPRWQQTAEAVLGYLNRPPKSPSTETG